MSTPSPESVVDAVAQVRSRIASAAARAGRDPAAVTLVAATKTVSVAQVRAVVAAGVPDVGENRAQELIAKA
ncbi:MAG: YggS family pyridoxal phosphate-dependent enzyme, partial [Acidimicrobiia bacterium]